MIVVSDTSRLNYVVLIDLQHILPELFERILIPAAVRKELQSAGAPEAIVRFMALHRLYRDVCQSRWHRTAARCRSKPSVRTVACRFRAVPDLDRGRSQAMRPPPWGVAIVEEGGCRPH